MAKQRTQTVVIRLPPNITRLELRLVCARIHDIADVVAVEIHPDQRSIRVSGDMRIDDLRAAISGRAGEFVS